MSVPQPSEPQPTTVKILTSRFDRINELRDLVDTRRDEVADAASRLKIAKAGFDATRDSFEKEVVRLLNFVKGVDELPLFANMTDAIDAATDDPVIDRLMRRLLDRGVAHLNILIVAGYTEEERGQIIAWLDAQDALDKAQADLAAGVEGVVLPTVPLMPAFLVPQETDEATATPANQLPTDAVIADALPHADLELTPEQIAALTLRQRWDLLTWIARVKHVKAEKGADLVFDDLPPALPFLADPSLIGTGEPSAETAAAADEPQTTKGKGKGKKKAGGNV